MSFTFVGQAFKEDNTYNVGEAVTDVAGAQEGDLMVLQAMTRGNHLFGAPSGWTTVQAVNNNNTTSGSPGRASNLVAWIVRGASAPDLVLTGHSTSMAVRCLIKVYRPGAGETVSFLGSSTLDESSGAATAHDHASIADLQADDLLCMEMSSGNLTSCRYGAADADTDPSTASNPPVGTTSDGTTVTTGMPTAGSWVNRYVHRSSTAASYLLFSADGVASATGASGTLTMASTAGANMVGATMAFRSAAAAGGFLAGATLATTIAAGTLQAIASAFVAGATLGDIVAGGTLGPQPGVITSQALTTNNGTILASTALDYVDVYLEASGVFVGRFTGLSTNGSGVFSITSALLTPGTAYKLDWRVTGGQRRMPVATAA